MDVAAFKPGDIVRLKGIDSPAMAVTATRAVLGLPDATCVWFRDGQMHCGTLAFAVLVKEWPAGLPFPLMFGSSNSVGEECAPVRQRPIGGYNPFEPMGPLDAAVPCVGPATVTVSGAGQGIEGAPPVNADRGRDGRKFSNCDIVRRLGSTEEFMVDGYRNGLVMCQKPNVHPIEFVMIDQDFLAFVREFGTKPEGGF